MANVSDLQVTVNGQRRSGPPLAALRPAFPPPETLSFLINNSGKNPKLRFHPKFFTSRPGQQSSRQSLPLADKRFPSLLGMKVHELARWTRFAAKGGIGKCIAVHDCVAQSSDDLMFLKVRSFGLVASGAQISNAPPTTYRTTRSLFLCNCRSSPAHIWSVSMSVCPVSLPLMPQPDP